MAWQSKLAQTGRGIWARRGWLGLGIGAGAFVGSAMQNPHGFRSGLEGGLQGTGAGFIAGGIGGAAFGRAMGRTKMGARIGAGVGAAYGMWYGARSYDPTSFGRPVQPTNYGFRSDFPGAQP